MYILNGGGAVGDNTNDDQPAIQACIDTKLNSNNPGRVNGKVVFRSATYKINSTIQVTRGDSLDGITLEGLAGYDYGIDGTIINAASITDNPALNIQGARGVRISGLTIIGGNVAPDTAQSTLSPTLSDWITAGLTSGQYNSYAGITIDALSGVDPGAGSNYTFDTYFAGGSNSHMITIDKCTIRYFVVGIIVGAGPNTQNKDNIHIMNTDVEKCAYGISCGADKAKGLMITNCGVTGHWCCFANYDHGAKIGAGIRIRGGQHGLAHQLFRLGNSRDIISCQDMHVESIGWLGVIGIDGSSSLTACIENCYINISAHPAAFKPLVQAYTCGQVLFRGCVMKLQTPFLNIKQSWANCKFEKCSINCYVAINYPIQVSHNNFSVARNVYCQDCTSNVPTFGSQNSNTLNRHMEIPSTAMAGRLDCAQFTKTIYDNANQHEYVPICPTDGNGAQMRNGLRISGATTNIAFTDTTMSFDHPNASYLMVGGWLNWMSTATYASSEHPALKITNITGTTITCDLLYSRTSYDETWNPGYLVAVAQPYVFVTKPTGDITLGSYDILNVSSPTSFRVGDLIVGTGQPIAFITNIVGTTITVTRAATATTVGISLGYWDLTTIY